MVDAGFAPEAPLQVVIKKMSHHLTVPCIYIILVNWNGWLDTVECLESIFRQATQPLRVIVCDNASTDNSLSHIEKWARGEFCNTIPNRTLMDVSYSLAPKLISYQRFSESELNQKQFLKVNPEVSLILIQNEKNGGFGYGNNIGMKFARQQSDCSFIWLLNNDTVLTDNALSEILNTASNHPNAVMGAILRYYDFPTKTQAYGGGYFSCLTGRVTTITAPPTRTLDFINGASIFMSSQIACKIGEFDQNIFMYFEEFDFAIRAKRLHIEMITAPIYIYHKVGSSSNKNDGDYIAWVNAYTNKYYVMKKHFGISIWTFFWGATLLANLANPKISFQKKQASLDAIKRILNTFRIKHAT